jgi:hypothetical protein
MTIDIKETDWEVVNLIMLFRIGRCEELGKQMWWTFGLH